VRITMEFVYLGDAVLRRIVAVVALIIKRGSNALIVGRNGTRSEHRTVVALTMVHLSDCVGLQQVLVSVPDVVNDAEIRLQDRVPVSERRIEFELVAQRGFALSHVV